MSPAEVKNRFMRRFSKSIVTQEDIAGPARLLERTTDI
jgi:hypothetical protein